MKTGTIAAFALAAVGVAHLVVLLRVREAELIGVRGTLYPRSGSHDVPDPDALVLHGSPDTAFVARQAVRELRNITVVAFAATAF